LRGGGSGDARLDTADVPALLRLLASGQDPVRADYNGDGRAGVADALRLLLDLRKGIAPHLGTIVRGQQYPRRWVWVFGKELDNEGDVEEIDQLARTASASGLNGMVLSAGLDMLDLKDSEYLRRLELVKAIADEQGLEIIPAAFSVGYGGAVISHNRNLAAGLPVVDSPFLVSSGQAHLIPNPGTTLSNGGFESYSGNTFADFTYIDKAGEYLFVDISTSKDGAAALRINVPTSAEEHNARMRRLLRLKPNRCYRLRFWYKSDRMQPDYSFNVNVIGQSDNRQLTFIEGGINTDNEWHEMAVGFNSWQNETAIVYFGVWNTTSARIWIDNLVFEEVGLTNVLRRPGTPLTVRNKATGADFSEGVDFNYIRDPYLTFRFDHEPPSIVIPAGSTIADGDTLAVSYFHGTRSNPVVGQVTVCMSEPELYDIWRTQARLIHERLAPKRYLLNMDEIRAGGTCKACTDRGLTMGEILGDCITKLHGIIREVNPEAELYIWSDMLDPNHNGSNRAGETYYLAAGLYDGSWNHIPRDLVIACWWDGSRHVTLPHFSGLGFRTLAASYYDANDLANVEGWLKSLDSTPGACGIMYTTWAENYELLGAFGELVSRGR